jgi:segregation and condensation protein B
MPKEDSPTAAEPPNESLLSLSRLREAFAVMLGEPGVAGHELGRVGTAHPGAAVDDARCPPYVCEVNPRSVVEAILFVGRPDNRPMSARELAAAMRGMSPAEIDDAVRELNAIYDADETPYCIEGTGAGYRLVLRAEFARMRDKFYGRVREARLSPAAVEVLSIVAYNQPITAPEIHELRGAPNAAALATLVRRRLVRLDRSEPGAPPRYTTTERFLKLFGLESLGALPRSEELEKV